MPLHPYRYEAESTENNSRKQLDHLSSYFLISQ